MPIEVGVDWAVPGADQTVLVSFAQQEASLVPWLERKRTIKIIPIRCNTCRKSSPVLILNKKTNRWECEGCCRL